MGRSPCCEKVGLKKGPWTPEEDQKLLAYIEENGHGSWRALPAKAGLQRCGKSCRLRWTNYLRPDIKRGKFTLHEEQTIIQLHALLGNRWSAIATHLPKRTDNEIKNYWNTHLKKRLNKMGIDPVTHKPKTDLLGSSSGHSKDAANLSHMAQWESARLEAEARLVRESKLASNNNVTLPNQLGFSASSAPLLTKAAVAAQLQPRPQCLDVLKAWQGVVSGMFAVPGDDLESPTTPLNFPGNTLPVPIIGFNENDTASGCAALEFAATGSVTCRGGIGKHLGSDQNEWKCFEKMDQMAQLKEKIDNSMATLHEMTSYSTDNAWFGDPFRAENIIMEGFSDILGCDSDDQQNNPLALAAGENHSGSCSNANMEESKNYWNSVLINILNASPSGSPVF